MRNFLKMTLAVICGFAIMLLISTFILLGILGASMSKPTVTLEPNTVLRLELSGAVQERSNELYDYASLLGGQEVSAIGLDDVLTALDKAAKNKNIVGIYLKCGALAAEPASVSEIRNALVRFKSSGKFVVAYADTYSQSAYQIASMADKVYLNPEGILELKGYAMQTVFFKDLLEKIGVEMQVVKVGTYKSAVEPYILEKMSDANREQMTQMAHSLWNQLLSDVSASRDISTESINAFADQGLMFAEAAKTLEYNLVDSLMYELDMERLLAQKIDIDESEVDFCSLKDMVNLPANDDYQRDKIAVVYAVGGIDSGNEQEENIDSEKLSKLLQKVAKEKNVKAVVLRVNSPGGSAFGSEQIWHALSQLKTQKPLIVSMGGYAASGGYYISCLADTIVAQPNTITGSIGIFGLLPNAKGLTKKIGISFDEVKTNRMSNFASPVRPLTTDERDIMQAYVNRGYELFVKRCADGRSMTTDAIKAIAEGRVWTGEQAQKLGLVDVLGNLDDAIAIAAAKAEIENYEIVNYPEKKDMLTQLLEEFSGIEAKFSPLGEYANYMQHLDCLLQSEPLQARLPYFLEVK